VWVAFMSFPSALWRSVKVGWRSKLFCSGWLLATYIMDFGDTYNSGAGRGYSLQLYCVRARTLTAWELMALKRCFHLRHCSAFFALLGSADEFSSKTESLKIHKITRSFFGLYCKCIGWFPPEMASSISQWTQWTKTRQLFLILFIIVLIFIIHVWK